MSGRGENVHVHGPSAAPVSCNVGLHSSDEENCSYHDDLCT